MKRWIALLAVLLLLPCPASARTSWLVTSDDEDSPSVPAVFTPDAFLASASDLTELPAIGPDGFLPEGEFVFEDAEAGLWCYLSESLRIEITRFSSDRPRRTWYEAEVWCTEDEAFRMINFSDGGSGHAVARPFIIARKRRSVLAMSTDFAELRRRQHKTMGIVIRNGEIESRDTWRAMASGIPNLDVLALWPDGSMAVFASDEHTAEEYLEMGVSSTLAFGPYLIRDGKPAGERLEKYGASTHPRAAIGMVEPGHYVCIAVEGRIPRSIGANLRFLAERFAARGCTLAFNLDGGGTAALIFLGKQLNKNGKALVNTSRHDREILGIGVSELVEPYSED